MKMIFRVLIIALIAIVAYNYFLGDVGEKQHSQEVINDITDLGKSVKKLILNEKDRFDEGKYDNIVEKVQDVYRYVGDNIGKISDEDKEEIKNQSEEVRKELEELKGRSVEADSVEINEKIETLLRMLGDIDKKLSQKVEEK